MSLIVDTKGTRHLRLVQPPVELPTVEFRLTDQKEKKYTTTKGHTIQGLEMDRYNPNVFRGVVRNSLFESMEKPFYIEVKGYGKQDNDRCKRLIIAVRGREDIKKIKDRNILSVETVVFNPKNGMLEIYCYGNSSGRMLLITIFPLGEYSVIVPDEFKPQFGLVTSEPEPEKPRIWTQKLLFN